MTSEALTRAEALGTIGGLATGEIGRDTDVHFSVHQLGRAGFDALPGGGEHKFDSGGKPIWHKEIRTANQPPHVFISFYTVEPPTTIGGDGDGPGFEGVGDFGSDDPFERHAAHQAAKGRR